MNFPIVIIGRYKPEDYLVFYWGRDPSTSSLPPIIKYKSITHVKRQNDNQENNHFLLPKRKHKETKKGVIALGFGIAVAIMGFNEKL